MHDLTGVSYQHGAIGILEGLEYRDNKQRSAEQREMDQPPQSPALLVDQCSRDEMSLDHVAATHCARATGFELLAALLEIVSALLSASRPDFSKGFRLAMTIILSCPTNFHGRCARYDAKNRPCYRQQSTVAIARVPR